jgi:hypothetical protein
MDPSQGHIEHVLTIPVSWVLSLLGQIFFVPLSVPQDHDFEVPCHPLSWTYNIIFLHSSKVWFTEMKAEFTHVYDYKHNMSSWAVRFLSLKRRTLNSEVCNANNPRYSTNSLPLLLFISSTMTGPAQPPSPSFTCRILLFSEPRS